MLKRLFFATVICLYFHYAHASDVNRFQENLGSKNGTYIVTYVYKGYLDTVKLRVYFLNDSIFIFAFDRDAENLKNFNTCSERGVAKLINYNSHKSWIGIIDYSNILENNKYKKLEQKRITSFEEAVLPNVNKDTNLLKNNDYVLLSFNFINNDLNIHTIEGSQKFYIKKATGRKVNSQHLDFILSDSTDKVYGKNKLVYYEYYKSNSQNYISKTNLIPQLLPIKEGIVQTNSKAISAKTSIKGFASFMQYIFIIQFDDNKNIANYGWVLRDNLMYVEK